MVKEWKGKYKDVIKKLEKQIEVFDEMLEEKDNFIQELILEIAQKERKMETMEFDLDSSVDGIHVSNSIHFYCKMS